MQAVLERNKAPGRGVKSQCTHQTRSVCVDAPAGALNTRTACTSQAPHALQQQPHSATCQAVARRYEPG